MKERERERVVKLDYDLSQMNILSLDVNNDRTTVAVAAVKYFFVLSARKKGV